MLVNSTTRTQQNTAHHYQKGCEDSLNLPFFWTLSQSLLLFHQPPFCRSATNNWTHTWKALRNKYLREGGSFVPRFHIRYANLKRTQFEREHLGLISVTTGIDASENCTQSEHVNLGSISDTPGVNTLKTVHTIWTWASRVDFGLVSGTPRHNTLKTVHNLNRGIWGRFWILLESTVWNSSTV